MKVLVTGGAGFIGAHIAAECLKQGYEVFVLDDLSGGFTDNIPNGCESTHFNITYSGCVEQLFAEHKFDYVFHFAAYAAEGLSHFIRRFNYENNVVGSMNLINASIRHGVKCFVFASSVAVYGRKQDMFIEEMRPEPIDPYGIAKLAVELDLKAAREMFGLNYVIFRPHNVYGPLQNIADPYRNVIGIFMRQCLQGEPLTIFGDGTQSRAFSYVADIVPTIVASVQNGIAYGHVFNIGSGVPYRLTDLAEKVKFSVQRQVPVKYLPARNEAHHATACHQKLEDFFGEQPHTMLDVGLELMATWLLSRVLSGQLPPALPTLEITKNLPEVWRAS